MEEPGPDLEAGGTAQAGRRVFRAVEARRVPEGHAETLFGAPPFEDEHLRRIGGQFVERGAHAALTFVECG